MDTVLTSSVLLAGLTAILATLLVVANRWLWVVEDPRVDDVEEMLPHANCGACGFPGCRPFAVALVAGQAKPASCTVSSDAGRARIASYLGVDVGVAEKRVARLACAGATNVARDRAQYEGVATCAAAALVGGGGKGCTWGCLGMGDCVEVCGFDALRLDRHALPVVDVDKCTACGDCVTACPKDLFSIHPVSHNPWVACSSEAHGDEALEDCEVACNACGRCAMDAPTGRIEMRRNLPIIHHEGPPLTRTPIERCPTGAIVWLAADGHAVKGAAAAKVVRNEPRRSAAT